MKDSDELPSTLDLRTASEKMSLDQFTATYARPALHLTLHLASRPRTGGDTKSAQEKSYERTATELPSKISVNRYHNRIAFLAKRAGNPFPNMISLGRALNNDLVIMLSTMSKLHGYFMCEGAAWSYIDHGSKNGTKINDEVLKKNERRAIRGGDRLRLGLELTATFVPTET